MLFILAFSLVSGSQTVVKYLDKPDLFHMSWWTLDTFSCACFSTMWIFKREVKQISAELWDQALWPYMRAVIMALRSATGEKGTHFKLGVCQCGGIIC